MDSKRFGGKVRTQSLTNVVVTVVRIIFLSCQIFVLPSYTAVCSCNNVAPVTTCVSAELQRGPIRHNGTKKKLQLKLTIYASNITITDDPSPC